MNKNYNELKREYLEWCKEFDEMEDRRMKNVVEKRPEYKEEWNVLEIVDYDKYDEPIFSHNEDISVKEFTRLVKEYKEYTRLCDRLCTIEYALYESKEELQSRYNEWKTENDIWEEAKEWGKELNNGHVKEQDLDDEDYIDWGSNDDIYDSMVESVNDLDKDKVDTFIEKLRLYNKNNEGCRDFYDEMIDYLECRNNALSGEEEYYEGGYFTVAVDTLENYDLWKPYRETFEDCLNNVAKEMQVDFRFER